MLIGPSLKYEALIPPGAGRARPCKVAQASGFRPLASDARTTFI